MASQPYMCAFCDRRETEAEIILHRSGVSICDRCVGDFSDRIAEHRRQRTADIIVLQDDVPADADDAVSHDDDRRPALNPPPVIDTASPRQGPPDPSTIDEGIPPFLRRSLA